MAFVEKTISSEIVYQGPVFKVRKHQVATVDGGTSVRDILEHSGGSVILAVTDEGKILMEKQYRKSLDRIVLELPAGKRDPNEDPLVTATRELEEETGYIAGTISEMMWYNPTCGYSNEDLYVYLAKDLKPGVRHLDPTEDLDVLEMEVDEVMDLIMKNEIKDSKTIIGVLFARQLGEI